MGKLYSNVNQIMILLMATVIFSYCSSPKYTYYFDRYQANSQTSVVRGGDKTGGVVVSGNDEAIRFSSSQQIQGEHLVASVSKEPIVQQSKNIAKGAIDLHIGGEPGHKIVQIKTPKTVTQGDKSKNRFAVMGFAMAFLPIVGTLVAAFLSPGTGLGIVIGGLGFVLGMIFCSIGLKSEKRELARAGKKILIIELVLAVIAVALVILFTPK